MNYLIDLNASLFLLINSVWTNPLLDTLMPALSRAGNLGVIWLVLLSAVAAFGKKTGRRIAVTGVVALAIGFVSSELIKDLTMRPRPFVTLEEVRLLVSDVGVHWPMDVAACIVLGLPSGWAGARLILGRWKRGAVKWTAKEPEGVEAAPEVEYVFREVLGR